METKARVSPDSLGRKKPIGDMDGTKTALSLQHSIHLSARLQEIKWL